MGLKKGLKKRTIYTLSIAGLCILLGSGYLLFRIRSGSDALFQSGSLAQSNLRAAPNFELPDREGQIHRLSDLKGAPVVIHFWASWCPPCLAEISKWVELASSYQDRPIRWVAISLDQNWTDALKVWTPPKPGTGVGKILSLLDTKGSVSDQFGTYQFPETYLLNSDLKIVTKWVGPQDWGGEEIRKLLNLGLRDI